MSIQIRRTLMAWRQQIAKQREVEQIARGDKYGDLAEVYDHQVNGGRLAELAKRVGPAPAAE